MGQRRGSVSDEGLMARTMTSDPNLSAAWCWCGRFPVFEIPSRLVTTPSLSLSPPAFRLRPLSEYPVANCHYLLHYTPSLFYRIQTAFSVVHYVLSSSCWAYNSL